MAFLNVVRAKDSKSAKQRSVERREQVQKRLRSKGRGGFQQVRSAESSVAPERTKS